MPKAFTWLPAYRAVSFTSSLPFTQRTFLAEFVRCCTWDCATLKPPTSAASSLRKLLLITGTLWMDCGCSCWHYSILASDLTGNGLVKVICWRLATVEFGDCFTDPLDLFWPQL